MDSKRSGRRKFLRNGAALAGLAVGAVRPASGKESGSETPEVRPRDTRAYGERSRFVTSARGPFPELHTPIEELMGGITPAGLHFVQGYGEYENFGAFPDFDPREHRLLIHGMVDRPLIFSMDDLMRFPSVSRVHFLQCAGGSGGSIYDPARRETFSKDPNTTQHWKTSCSEWTGVLLSVLLKETGLQKGASWIIPEGADSVKHTRSVPLNKALNDCIIAYGQNGEPVRPEQGHPVRLLVPGWEGNHNVKWLRRIKVVDQPAMSITETTRYSTARPNGKSVWFQFEMPPHSVITFPFVGKHLPERGFYEIRGLAWSGSGAIRRVEVSTDGGRSWKNAALQEPVHRIAHTRFRFPWNWDGGETVVQSRCTDDLGQVQPSLAELSKNWGVSLDYWTTSTNKIGHFNPIQPWRITREGIVQNALLL